MISTMMACVGTQMTQEGTGLKIMKGKVRYTVAINKLTIYSANGGNAIPFSKKKIRAPAITANNSMAMHSNLSCNGIPTSR